MGVSAVSQRPSNGRTPGGVSLILAALAVVVGTTVLPFAGVGGTSRSLVGALQSAARVGLVSSPVRIVVALAALALPVSAIVLIAFVLGGRASAAARTAGMLAVSAAAAAVLGFWATGSMRGGSAVTLAGAGGMVGSLLLARRSMSQLGADPQSSLPGRRRGVRLAATGVLGVLGVAGLWVFCAGLRGGSGNAQAAAATFTTALRQGDNLAALEQLDPFERAALFEQGPRLLHELSRLRVVQRAAAAGDSTAGGAVRVGPAVALADGLSSVRIDGALSVPTVLVKSLGADAADTVRWPGQLVAVRRGDRWYVSIMLTAAEARRVALGRRLPDTPVEPAGAPNPEAAVRQMLSAIAAVDLPGFISVLDPDEAAAIYRYGLVQQPEVDRLAAWSQANAVWSFPDVGLSSEVSGSRAAVRVTRLSAQLDLPSDFGVGSSAVLNGDCVRVTVERETSRHCGAAIPQVIADLFGTTAPDVGDLDWLSSPQDLGEIVVVKRSDRWFVAPLRSLAASSTVRLRTYDPRDLEGAGNDLPARVKHFAENPLVTLLVGR